MVKLDMGEKKYLAVSQHFQQINQTPIVTNNAAKVLFRIKIFGKKIQATESFISCALFCILAEISPDQQSHLNVLKEDKQLDELADYKQLLTMFTTQELMNWTNIEQSFGAKLRAHSDIFDKVNSLEK